MQEQDKKQETELCSSDQRLLTEIKSANLINQDKKNLTSTQGQNKIVHEPAQDSEAGILKKKRKLKDVMTEAVNAP